MRSPEIRSIEFGADDQKRSEGERREIEEKINKEQEWAQESLAGLIDIVNERYESPESTLTGSPAQLESFKEHNAEILNLCIERGIEKDLTEKDIRTLEVAAILHDLAKGDKSPSDKEDIKNYILAAHGEIGAQEVRSILEKNPEMLNKALGENYSEKEAEELIAVVEDAIRSHMGPHPGFMTGILKGVNKELGERGEAEIEHLYPKEGNIVAETLLAADMRSLAGRKGREKVLAIRAAVPVFKAEDKALCEEYKRQGIDLTLGEAALLSGFESAKQARDMLKDSDDRKWINNAIEDSKERAYLYGVKDGLETVTYKEAVEKERNLRKPKQKKIQRRLLKKKKE